MPTHAIIVTWLNMETDVLPHFISRAQAAYGANLDRLYFDSASLANELQTAVNGVTNINPLKIFISGHGGTGIDYITDNGETRKKTVDDLANLLLHGLAGRATAMATSGHTQINMVSCLFGRTSDGSPQSPAVKLHAKLAASHVYVDVVARTESIVAMAGGRQTITAMNHAVYEPVFGKQARFLSSKTPYTKVRCTFAGASAVVQLAKYDGSRTYEDATSTVGKRLLWADHACNELTKRIKLEKTGPNPTDKAVTDPRQKGMEAVVNYYDVTHNTTVFKLKLEALVDGTGDDEQTNFLTHRNKASAFISSKFTGSEPASATLVRQLLSEWPG